MGPLIELIDQLLAELEQRASHSLGVFRPVRFDQQRADAAGGFSLYRDETLIGPVQRFEILAPEPDPGEARDQVALRLAQQAAQGRLPARDGAPRRAT